jgi:pyoverdine/dityrosine biosynthesis protein Dit1
MIIQQIFEILSAYSNNQGKFENFSLVPLYEQIKEKVEGQRPLTFLLPAFPAKSPSPEKTVGPLPDLGEVLALSELNLMCEKISKIYPAGASVVICSDGRVFSDVVKVSDDHIDQYSQGIKDIIEEFKLIHLSTFALDDLYSDLSNDELRETLMKNYAKSDSEIRFYVKNDANWRNLFNGIHRFMMEDQAVFHPEKSRSQLQKETKKLTYELVRRSDAWGELLSAHFQGELRLSIHPYPIYHNKFGIKMVHSSNKWATPWHNVTVKSDKGYELMHLSEAKKLNPTRRIFKEKYVYFEV